MKPKHEKASALALTHQDLEVFLPLYQVRRRWSDRLKELEVCLFPGYLFCRFGYEERLRVLGTPGVLSVVGFGKKPAAIEEAEVAAVQAVVESGLPAQPWPYLRQGQRVRIERGALCGLEGILLRERDACRIVVSIELLQRSLAVEIDRDLVGPAARSPWWSATSAVAGRRPAGACGWAC